MVRLVDGYSFRIVVHDAGDPARPLPSVAGGPEHQLPAGSDDGYENNHNYDHDTHRRRAATSDGAAVSLGDRHKTGAPSPRSNKNAFHHGGHRPPLRLTKWQIGLNPGLVGAIDARCLAEL